MTSGGSHTYAFPQQRIGGFRVYKQLPEDRKEVELHGCEGVDAAAGMVEESIIRYQADC